MLKQQKGKPGGQTSKLQCSLPLLCIALVSCSSANVQESITTKEPSLSSGCRILSAQEWRADILRTKQPGENLLVLKGTVTMPSPGYGFTMQMRSLDRRSPPGMTVHLLTSPPDSPVMQMLSEEQIQVELSTPLTQLRNINILCEKQSIGRLTDIAITS